MVDQQSSRPDIEASLAPFVIRPQQADDIDAVVALSLRAWQPVFESMGRVLGPRLNRIVYPDWAAGQARAVEEVCRDEGIKVWVAEVGTEPVGFVAVAFHDDPRSAGIDMIAVDPDQQCRGIGSALLASALDRISAAGIHLAHLGTGGDPGHAAAASHGSANSSIRSPRCAWETPQKAGWDKAARAHFLVTLEEPVRPLSRHGCRRQPHGPSKAVAPAQVRFSQECSPLPPAGAS